MSSTIAEGFWLPSMHSSIIAISSCLYSTYSSKVIDSEIKISGSEKVSSEASLPVSAVLAYSIS